STAMTRPPYPSMRVRMAKGIVSEVNTTLFSPARAAYAAAATPWLPVEATPTAPYPSSSALATAAAQYRSLWDHVGLRLSSLAYSAGVPQWGPKGRRGVSPSPRLTFRSVAPSTGRNA